MYPFLITIFFKSLIVFSHLKIILRGLNHFASILELIPALTATFAVIKHRQNFPFNSPAMLRTDFNSPSIVVLLNRRCCHHCNDMKGVDFHQLKLNGVSPMYRGF